MVKEFTASNGSRCVINHAGFRNASMLKRAMEKELLKININIKDLEAKRSLSEILKIELNSDMVNQIKNVLCVIDSSEDVENALFTCLSRSLINDVKISEESFNSEDGCAIYYEICLACLEVNVLPFFKNLATILAPLITRSA